VLKIKNILLANPPIYLFFLLPFVFIFILRLSGFDGLYGQDSYEYFRYTKAISNYLRGEPNPGSYYWPVLYPFIAAVFSFFFRSIAFSLQFLSCLSLSLSCFFLYKTLKLLYPKQPYSFLYILIFGMFSPFLLKMGVIVMSDMTTAVFVIMSFHFLIKSHLKKTNLIPVFLFASCALFTRYPSLVITFPILLYAFYLIVKRKKTLQFLMSILASSLVAIPFLIFQWDSLFEASSNYFLNSWSFQNFFKSSYTTIDGLQSYRHANGIYALYLFLHPGFLFIGFLFLFYTVKYYKGLLLFHQKLLLFCILLYSFFLAGIPFQNTRILGLVFPFVLLFYYPAFLQVIKIKLLKKTTFTIVIISFLIQISLWFFTFKHILKRSIFENKMIALVMPYQGNKLYSFDIDISLKGRDLNFDYKNMYMELYEKFENNALVLFHPTKFNKTWKGKNTILNWEKLQKNYNLRVLKKGPEGWNLYQIKMKK